MIFWGDKFRMPRPDEFRVNAVRSDGCVWERLATYQSRAAAMESVGCMDRSRYRLIAVEPHSSECGFFQTHASEIVYDASMSHSERF